MKCSKCGSEMIKSLWNIGDDKEHWHCKCGVITTISKSKCGDEYGVGTKITSPEMLREVWKADKLKWFKSDTLEPFQIKRIEKDRGDYYIWDKKGGCYCLITQLHNLRIASPPDAVTADGEQYKECGCPTDVMCECGTPLSGRIGGSRIASPPDTVTADGEQYKECGCPTDERITFDEAIKTPDGVFKYCVQHKNNDNLRIASPPDAVSADAVKFDCNIDECMSKNTITPDHVFPGAVFGSILDKRNFNDALGDILSWSGKSLHGDFQGDRLHKHDDEMRKEIQKFRQFAEEAMVAMDYAQAHLRKGLITKQEALEKLDIALNMNPTKMEKIQQAEETDDNE